MYDDSGGKNANFDAMLLGQGGQQNRQQNSPHVSVLIAIAASRLAAKMAVLLEATNYISL